MAPLAHYTSLDATAKAVALIVRARLLAAITIGLTLATVGVVAAALGNTWWSATIGTLNVEVREARSHGK